MRRGEREWRAGSWVGAGEWGGELRRGERERRAGSGAGAGAGEWGGEWRRGERERRAGLGAGARLCGELRRGEREMVGVGDIFRSLGFGDGGVRMGENSEDHPIACAAAVPARQPCPLHAPKRLPMNQIPTQ